MYFYDITIVAYNTNKEQLDLLLTIHMDPIVVNDPEVDKLQKIVIESIKKLDNELKIHDFRVVKGITHTNILFDCVVPYEKDHTNESLINHLLKTIKPENEPYFYIVEIDRPFS